MHTILLLKVSQKELFCLKGILESYAQATCLRVNYAKSCMIPLNMDTDHAQILAGVFGECLLPTWDCPWETTSLG
jgi:hypothetical protein